MPRLGLKLLQVPAGVAVSFPGGGELLEGRSGHYTLGLDPSCDVVVSVDPQAWSAFCRDGWGGRTNAGLTIDPAGRWTVAHPGHGGALRVNGEALVERRRELFPGDRVEPSLGLVFEVVDLERVVARGEPPEALLDAVAERPGDEGRWHVLADWLIEHQAPHALMAAYELKLRDGTSDPELLGEYASTRRERHVLSELRFDHVSWKCGYVVACSLWLGPRDRLEPQRLGRAFAGPVFGALSRVTLLCNGTESRARLESVLAALPSTVRVVGLQFSAAVPMSALLALGARPPRAHTLRLHLAAPLGPLGPSIDALVGSGWATISLEGTRLAERADELRGLLERHPTTRFMLGGTSLPAPLARAIDRPNVDWAGDDHDALLVELDTGAVLPLSRARPGFAWGVAIVPFADGWTTPDGLALFASGELVRDAGRRFVFLQRANLSAAYRQWLAAAAPSP